MIAQLLKILAFSAAGIFFLDISSINAFTQSPTLSYDTNYELPKTIEKQFSKNKIIPLKYQKPILIALSHYPELADAHIEFKLTNSKTPLMARPSVWSTFVNAKHRRYIISISEKTSGAFEPIFLRNLSFEAQIGVLGHELSHISDFHSRWGIYYLKLLFMQLSSSSLDKMEYDTDVRAIKHGLGNQLLKWSTEVRSKLNIKEWNGVKETKGDKGRYMNPDQIRDSVKTMKSEE